MKNAAVFFCVVILSAIEVFASQCFIAKEGDRTIIQEGDCSERYAPCSTFKIVLSLIGYDTKILQDQRNPVWRFKKGYPDWLDSWKQNQMPQSWIKNSCVWYSQVLTKKLGMEKLQQYVDNFSYGNKDLSGDAGQDNGLTNSWLSSSLEISGSEQVAFLIKLLKGELPVSAHAHSMTKKILYVGDLPDGWKLYGKRASGVLLSEDRTQKLKFEHGWFVGWIEKGDRIIIFSKHIADHKKENTFASKRAELDAKARLITIIKGGFDQKS